MVTALEGSQALRVEHELIATRPKQVLLSKLGEGQAHRLTGNSYGLSKLLMRDSEHNAFRVRRRRGRLAEADKRLEKPLMAVLKDEPGCIGSRRGELTR